MKLKYYLRGAGIGVIVSTLILMIAFGVYQGKTKENAPTETETASKDLTIAEALSELETEAGTETAETEEPAITPEETEAQQPETSEAVEETAEEEAGDEAEAVDDTDGQETMENGGERIEPDDNTGEGEDAGADVEDTGVTVKKTVSVVVRNGDSPMVVSRMLAEAGVVDDADLFYRYLLDHGLNDGIEVGSFSIPEGADYETIAKLITTNEYESRMQR
ncbi:MAG: hypothetical protein IJJ13_00255 [Lachnospiraceae bacterium]|nr:hypothetical protein [Lachnospiraceae bacterium]